MKKTGMLALILLSGLSQAADRTIVLGTHLALSEQDFVHQAPYTYVAEFNLQGGNTSSLMLNLESDVFGYAYQDVEAMCYIDLYDPPIEWPVLVDDPNCPGVKVVPPSRPFVFDITVNAYCDGRKIATASDNRNQTLYGTTRLTNTWRGVSFDIATQWQASQGCEIFKLEFVSAKNTLSQIDASVFVGFPY